MSFGGNLERECVCEIVSERERELREMTNLGLACIYSIGSGVDTFS